MIRGLLSISLSMALFSGSAYAIPNFDEQVKADLPFISVFYDVVDSQLFYTFPETYAVCNQNGKLEFSFSSFQVPGKSPQVVVQYNLCPSHSKFAEAAKALEKKYPGSKLVYVPLDSIVADEGLWDLVFDGLDVKYQCAPVVGSKVDKVSCQISAQGREASKRLHFLFADNATLVLNGYFDLTFSGLRSTYVQRTKGTVEFGVLGMKDHPELLKIEWKP